MFVLDVDTSCSPPFALVPSPGGSLRQDHVQCDCDGRTRAGCGQRACGCGEQGLRARQRARPSPPREIESPASLTLADRLDGRYKSRCDASVLHHLDPNSRRTYGTGWRAWVDYAAVNRFAPTLAGLALDTPVRTLALYFAVHPRTTRFTKSAAPVKSVTIDQYITHVADALVTDGHILRGTDLRSNRLTMLLEGYAREDDRGPLRLAQKIPVTYPIACTRAVRDSQRGQQ